MDREMDAVTYKCGLFRHDNNNTCTNGIINIIVVMGGVEMGQVKSICLATNSLSRLDHDVFILNPSYFFIRKTTRIDNRF